MMKRLTVLLFLLLATFPAMAKQIIVGGSDALIVASTTIYSGPMGYVTAYPTTDATAYEVIPTGGTIDLMAMKPSASPSASATITLYKNGSSTSLTCSTSTASVCHDSTHSVSVAAGDKVSVEIVVAGGATSRSYSWSVRFTPSIAGESILIGSSRNTAPAANQFVSMANPTTPSSTSNATIDVIPETGLFKKFYVTVDSDPTVPTSTVTFTVFQNGGTGNNTCTITALGSLSCNDTTHTDTVATIGNFFNIKVTTATAPTLSPFHWGIVYVSPTAGNFLMVANTAGGSTSAAGSRNIPISGNRAVTTNGQSFVSNAFTAKQIYSKLITAPGVGTSWDFIFQVSAADTALLVNIAGTNSKGGTTTDVTVNLDDTLQFRQNPNTGSPTGSMWQCTLVGNLPDNAATDTNFLIMF